MSVPHLGRLGQLYIRPETAYGAGDTFVATDAVRHLDVDLTFNALGRKDAPDRQRTPGLRRRYTTRTSGSFDLKKALMWPSGTIGTVPDLNNLLLNGIGSKRTPALSTTVASGPTTTSATLTAVTGLAIGDPILHGASKLVRVVTNIVGSVVTWAPALPVAPTNGDTVKTGVGYQPVTNPANSLVIGHYIATQAQTFIREMRGAVVDKLAFTFDSNSEPFLQASGPLQTQLRDGAAQSQPGSFTSVGTAIPSGITGGLYVGATAYPMQKCIVNVNNNMTLRNIDFGTSKASGFYRRGMRQITVQVDAYVEDPSAIYANAETAANVSILMQCGLTEGQIWAVYLPLTQWEIPSTPDQDTELVWSFKGVALESSAGNDDILVAQM